MPTTVSTTLSFSIERTPKSTYTFSKFLKRAKEILILALKVIVLGGLALYQGELFLAGLIAGLLIKAIWRDKCTDAIRNVQEVVAKRPWLFFALGVTTAIVIPGSVLVIPPFVGGFYTGVKTINFCLALNK